MDRWILVEENIPKDSMPVIGFSLGWIDDDFNPKGQRECFVTGSPAEPKWVSAKWYDEQDCFITDEETAPTHWLRRPSSPI